MIIRKYGYVSNDINENPTHEITINVDAYDVGSICETETHVIFFDRSSGELKKVDKNTFSIIETIITLPNDYIINNSCVNVAYLGNNIVAIADGGCYLFDINTKVITETFTPTLTTPYYIYSCVSTYIKDGEVLAIFGDPKGMITIRDTDGNSRSYKCDEFEHMIVSDTEYINVVKDNKIVQLDEAQLSLGGQRVFDMCVMDNYMVMCTRSTSIYELTLYSIDNNSLELISKNTNVLNEYGTLTNIQIKSITNTRLLVEGINLSGINILYFVDINNSKLVIGDLINTYIHPQNKTHLDSLAIDGLDHTIIPLTDDTYRLYRLHDKFVDIIMISTKTKTYEHEKGVNHNIINPYQKI